MFKKMTVGKKIIMGFSTVLLLLVVVGLTGYNGLSTADRGFTEYREMARDTNLAGRLQANMLMTRMNVKDFIITGSEKDQQEYQKYYHKMEEFLHRAQEEIQAPERAKKIDIVDEQHIKYNQAFHQVVAYQQQRDEGLYQGLAVIGPKAEKDLTAIMTSAEKDGDATAAYHAGLALRNLLLARLYAQKFLDTNAQKDVDRVLSEFETMKTELDILDRELENVERRKHMAAAADGMKAYQKVFLGMVDTIYKRNELISGTLDRIGPEIADQVEDVKLDIKAVQDKLGPELVASNSRSIVIISIVALIALLTGTGLAFVIIRGITKPLNRVITGVSEGTEQVASASGQVSAASQKLAEGSAEQAASIEETSSSLEEMSAMTNQNADNARQADNLMKEANQVVTKANRSMTDLTKSMEDISTASEETSKIIKTIDEIAFQTNLLALNAAVEAARAGEAGAGFAVVADEVRNLALRAADAAKNTADLIEGTVKKVNEGGELVATTNEAFSEVADSSAKVGELVAEIAAASGEQAQGIELVNTAINEMDKIVQENAASAEENASASEEMSAQSSQMKVYVAEMTTLVGGVAKDDTDMNQLAAQADEAFKADAHVPTQTVAASPKQAPQPKQLLPLDDDELEEF